MYLFSFFSRQVAKFGNMGKISWTSVNKFAIFCKGSRVKSPNYFGGGLCSLSVAFELLF